MKDKEYCDHCGDEITKDERTGETGIVVPCLSQDIASANAGESAIMCYNCYFTFYNKDLK